ncbi:MAG: hypothetical protein V4489_05350 [Chlamydiota bacterium]
MSAISAFSNSSNPGISFISGNSLQRCIEFRPEITSDLNNFRLVNKTWKRVIDGSEGQILWKEASIREGVPIVQGEDRNYKDDFKFLRPITISSKIIGKYLGEVVGEVPLIRKAVFDRLKCEKDSFEVGKFQRDTHVVIVDPAKLKITISPDRPLELDETGTLIELPVKERAWIVNAELTVPFSFKNLRMLANYPLEKIGMGPVFNKGVENFGCEVFERCDTPPDQNRILIMRREVFGSDMLFNAKQHQRALVTNRGWKVVTVRQRGFYDVIMILKTGTCPDGAGPLTYARSAESVRCKGLDHKAAVGGFSSKTGLSVHYDNLVWAYGHVGVVPGVSAECVVHPLSS